jgi:ER membrane protein complex subunit 2
METDLDLPALIQRNDHLNVLRYIRIHQLREPDMVLHHGRALLGADLVRKSNIDTLSRLAVLEQICLAALDVDDSTVADLCLSRLCAAGVEKSSTRFRLLLARCLESAHDYNGASIIYDECLKENPANTVTLKRKYCLLKAMPGRSADAAQALQGYLEQNYSDTAAWRELASLYMELGDWKKAGFCMEEVLLAVPSHAPTHCLLAECYATSGNLLAARKHMAQALEFNPHYLRAQVGLVVVSNAYLLMLMSSNGKKDSGGGGDDQEHEREVATELVKYGVEKVIMTCKGQNAAVVALMEEYRDSL